MPAFKNRFPLYKKSISSTPVSLSTTLLLESVTWCLSSQRIIQPRCLILWYECDLTSPCELPPEKSLSGEETKRRKSPARAVLAAGFGGGQGSQVLKDSCQGRRGLPDPLQEGETCLPPASGGGVDPLCRTRRESSWVKRSSLVFHPSPGREDSLPPRQPAASCWGSLGEQWRARGCGLLHPSLDPRGLAQTAHGPSPRTESALLQASSPWVSHPLSSHLSLTNERETPERTCLDKLFGGNKWTWLGLSFLFCIITSNFTTFKNDLVVSYKVKYTLLSVKVFPQEKLNSLSTETPAYKCV